MLTVKTSSLRDPIYLPQSVYVLFRIITIQITSYPFSMLWGTDCIHFHFIHRLMCSVTAKNYVSNFQPTTKKFFFNHSFESTSIHGGVIKLVRFPDNGRGTDKYLVTVKTLLKVTVLIYFNILYIKEYIHTIFLACYR